MTLSSVLAGHNSVLVGGSGLRAGNAALRCQLPVFCSLWFAWRGGFPFGSLGTSLSDSLVITCFVFWSLINGFPTDASICDSVDYPKQLFPVCSTKNPRTSGLTVLTVGLSIDSSYFIFGKKTFYERTVRLLIHGDPVEPPSSYLREVSSCISGSMWKQNARLYVKRTNCPPGCLLPLGTFSTISAGSQACITSIIRIMNPSTISFTIQ